MRIGIFGGSFDPVHKEHVQLARVAVRELGLDKLFIVPAGTPPHKAGKKLASARDRLEMCRIAFADLPQAEVDDWEIRQEGKSYTYLTCRRYAALYPKSRLYLLVGTDMFWDFFHWKEPDDILSRVTLAVCRRNEEPENISSEQEAFKARFSRTFEVIPYNGLPTSSTIVRACYALGKDVFVYLPAGVGEYIRKNGLYSYPVIEKGLSLEKPSRAEHSCRVCLMAARNAARFHLDEEKVLLASALHDVAKNLPPDSPYLAGFVPPNDVPMPVMHQFSGAYVLEHAFGISDGEILNAVRYHTSGRAGMGALEKLVFLCDMLEEERAFAGVEELRRVFEEDADECLYLCLKRQVEYLGKSGSPVYPLTKEAYEYYSRKRSEK